MSYPVVGVIWLWVYNYDWGIANLVLRAVGFGTTLRPGWPVRSQCCRR